ncbi:P-type DNA transfer protein VirB5 [Cronobacter sakazakii]|nr:P-type DNA transfer protein VirB5 [Cronobacter sakazakii]
MNKKLLSVIFAALFSSHAVAVGIPVYDAASMTNALNTIVQLKAQLEQLKTLQSQFEGVRGMGNLLNKPELRNMLPSEWKNVYDDVKNGRIEGLSGRLEQLQRQEEVTGTRSELDALRDRRWNQSLSDKVMGEGAFNATMKRLDNLEALGRQINSSQDAKASMDFLARMQQEQALVQSEAARLQLMSMLQQNEDRINAQKEERIQKQIWDIKKPMPRF